MALTFEEWKGETRLVQQNFSDMLGDRTWDEFDLTEDHNNGRDLLFAKIAFSLFGPPPDPDSKPGSDPDSKPDSESLAANNDDIDNLYHNEYTDEQVAKVHNIQEKIIKHQSPTKVVMAVIFMTGYKKSTKETMIVPVFRLKKDDESDTKYSLYVDLIGRVYQDWTDLMQNNVFLQWMICLPTFGMYTYDGEVQLIFQDQSEWGKVLKNIDKASTISSITTGVVAVGGLMLTLFPPTAPIGAATLISSSIVGAPGAAYGTGRSIGRLVDRSTHDQSLSIVDSEARACWLSTMSKSEWDNPEFKKNFVQ